MLTRDDADDMAEELETLGDLSQLFEAMFRQGWTKGSVSYVMERTWWV